MILSQAIFRLVQKERKSSMLKWKITNMASVAAAGELLTIWTAEEYTIGEICGYYTLYRNDEKLGVFRSMEQAQKKAERDAQPACKLII